LSPGKIARHDTVDESQQCEIAPKHVVHREHLGAVEMRPSSSP
jgi:hypothetical protein